jgi:hypothetical protein
LVRQSIDELDGGVVMDLKSFGEDADRDGLALRDPTYLEQDEVLLGRYAGGVGGQLTNAKEAPHLIAKLGKCLVIDRGDSRTPGGGATHHRVSIS